MQLTRDRNTPLREGELIPIPVAAAANIHAGALLAMNAFGYAQPATNVAGVIAAGRAEAAIDNTAGADGAETVLVRRGVFKFANDATLPVTQAQVLQNCYIRDDQTVRAFDPGAGAPNPVAGKVLGVESDGVWVEVR